MRIYSRILNKASLLLRVGKGKKVLLGLRPGGILYTFKLDRGVNYHKKQRCSITPHFNSIVFEIVLILVMLCHTI